MKAKKVGVYVAHDDDAILGVGGKISRYIKQDTDVYIVVCTDGRHSHKAVLNITKNPTPIELMRQRKQEMIKAAGILGVRKSRLFFLNQIDGEGERWQNNKRLAARIDQITRKEKPDVIYFHFPDAHIDHRAVSSLIKASLKNWGQRGKVYQFFIWNKDLAKGRSEVDLTKVPAIPAGCIKVTLNQKELALKRKSMFAMKSQVDVWPYLNWQVQKLPILDKKFLDYFLRGEELFI